MKSESARYAMLCRRASERGMRVTLTIDEFMDVRRSNECHYCGGALPAHGYGLDRKDNARGYTKTNVVACCGDCNVARGAHLTHDEFAAAMSVRVARVGRGRAWPTAVEQQRARAYRDMGAWRLRRSYERGTATPRTRVKAGVVTGISATSDGVADDV